MKFDPIKLKQARKAKGLKQSELARAIGSIQPVVCNWEKGRQCPGAAAVIKMADELSVDPRFFFTTE
jgi:transcriptional regulator with XRE-family HTH domain